MTDEWRAQSFRQSVIAKIEEAIRQSGMATSRNSIEMESHVFQKAKTREEYLGFVARLILHVREMNSKKGGAMNGQGIQQGTGIPDPITSLQSLASQGTRNNQMMGMAGPQGGPMGGPQQMPQITATNLLQAINRGPAQNMGNMQPGMPTRPQMGIGPNGVPMGNQMGNPMPGQMTGLGGQMPNQQMPQMGGQMPNQQMNPLAGQMNAQMVQSQAMQGQVQSHMQGGMAPMGGGQMPGQMMGQMQIRNKNEMMMNAPNAGFPRNSTPNQFLRQSPSPSAQSPAGLTGGPGSNQMVASPALAPSPSSHMNLMGGAQRGMGMAPSPSSSLNTPLQPNQSPMGGHEDAAYREKLRQLSRYVEPLQKMIGKISNDAVNLEKLGKMKKLLEILVNPQHRVMPLETILKCEMVLEKLDFKKADGVVLNSNLNSIGSISLPNASFSVSTLPNASNVAVYKETHPLIEAISNTLQSPSGNHTLHRTFGPTLEALFGPEIKLVPPLKRKRVEEPTSEIPEVLQGEIARLDQRFKVSLDPNQQTGSKTIQLICWLDDKHLPCVPPVSLTVPENYPKTSPTCTMAAHEYNATEFLSGVQTALNARIKKLPKHFSVSQLLDTWEMSVRQASAPSHVPVTNNTLLMGL